METNRMDEMTGARIAVDYENNAEVWWDAAREAIARCTDAGVLEVFRALENDEWTGPQDKAEAFLAWARGMPGWDGGPRHAPNPLMVDLAEDVREMGALSLADVRQALARGEQITVPYHVGGYGPGRTCHSWGAPVRGEARGPEGYLRLGLDDAGRVVIAEDDEDVCPSELHGAIIDGPGRVIVEDA